MVLTYNEAVEKYGTAYKLSRAVEDQMVYKQEDGIYSTDKYVSELGIIMKKYPKAVLTGEYAFYSHGLTNVIPEKYDLATLSKASKISDLRVHQVYVREDLFPLGITNKTINFMAAVTIFSDFGAQEYKICHCFHFSPFHLP